MTSGACTSHEAHGYRFITERSKIVTPTARY
jgi:hypothetical protein